MLYFFPTLVDHRAIGHGVRTLWTCYKDSVLVFAAFDRETAARFCAA